MRKVPGLTSCTLCRVWPAAFRSWPWATWATWAWVSPDSCRMGCEIVVALEDETCTGRERHNQLQLHKKAEKEALLSRFYVGGCGSIAQWIIIHQQFIIRVNDELQVRTFLKSSEHSENRLHNSVVLISITIWLLIYPIYMPAHECTIRSTFSCSFKVNVQSLTQIYQGRSARYILGNVGFMSHHINSRSHEERALYCGLKQRYMPFLACGPWKKNPRLFNTLHHIALAIFWHF